LLLTTNVATSKKTIFSAFLFILVWSKVRIRRVFYYTRQSGVSIRTKWIISTLAVARYFLKCCLAEIINIMFKFVKAINRNTVSVFSRWIQ